MRNLPRSEYPEAPEPAAAEAMQAQLSAGFAIGLVDLVATAFAAPQSSPIVIVPKPFRTPGDHCFLAICIS